MAKEVDGGPVSPQEIDVGDQRLREAGGLTVWDAYAMSYGGRWTRDGADQDARYMRTTEHAEAAAEYADHMMAERRKRGIGS